MITDYKIENEDYIGKDVASLPDAPNEGASALKARFDSLSKNVIAPKHNSLIEALNGSDGASNIGVTTIDDVEGSNVQTALAGLKAYTDNKFDIVNYNESVKLKIGDGTKTIYTDWVNSPSNKKTIVEAEIIDTISSTNYISKLISYVANDAVTSFQETRTKTSSQSSNYVTATIETKDETATVEGETATIHKIRIKYVTTKNITAMKYSVITEGGE